MIIAMVILFGILFIGLCVAMPASTRLGVAMFLVIPQFYFGSAPVPVSSAWIIFMGITAFVDRKVRLHQPAIIIPLFCIALFDLIYSMFSVIPGDALSACLRLIIFVILISYLFSITRQEKKSFQTAMNLLIPWIIIEAVLVWIFRLNPSIELAFLKSGFGQVFVGPAAAGLFTGAPNNVLDVVKAGGLFVNANVASMFLGISVFVCLSMAQRAKKIIFCIVALFTWTAIFATGSKTGIALAIVLPAVAFVVPYLFMRHRRRWIGPFVLFTSFLIYSGPSLIEMFFPSYADSSTISLDSRLVLWDAASVLFSQHPASGLGFGGWMEQIVQFSSDRPLPPHNLLLQLGLIRGFSRQLYF